VETPCSFPGWGVNPLVETSMGEFVLGSLEENA
jgi:hypothetical protein